MNIHNLPLNEGVSEEIKERRNYKKYTKKSKERYRVAVLAASNDTIFKKCTGKIILIFSQHFYSHFRKYGKLIELATSKQP